MSTNKTSPDEPTAEDPAGLSGEAAPEERAKRLVRSEHRAAMMDLKALGNRLAKLPQSRRRTLPLDERLQDELDQLAAAGQMQHRRRLLMRVKLMLGSVDLDRLAAVLGGDTDQAALERVMQHWRTRILAGDDAVLQAFIEAYPAADRQALRTAVRDSRREGPAAARASYRLLQLLREAAAVVPEPDPPPDAE
ncbi:MAG: ribosome biogenesis factor YjgA [Myxococcota bacterium]